VHLSYAKHLIPQTRHDMIPQNACTELSLCTANPNTVTCNTEDFATSCNLYEPQESNNRTRYNRKQTTHWNKRQKVYLKEGSSKPAPSFTHHVCFCDTRVKTMQLRLFISRPRWRGEGGQMRMRTYKVTRWPHYDKPKAAYDAYAILAVTNPH